jgi:hypothetical protein
MGPRERILIWMLALMLGLATACTLHRLFAFGESGYHTTVLVYALLGGICLLIFRPLRCYNLLLASLSIIAVLLMAETFLRFVHKYPITYSEMNGGGYASMFKADEVGNLYQLVSNGRPDAFTLQYPPGIQVGMTSVDYVIDAYTTNALGLRGPLPKNDGQLVFTLGDSFTQGAGTPCDSSYPVLLGQLLNKEGPEWDVMNLGVSGNDPFFDWQMLQKVYSQYPPEQVIFMVNTTDINDVMMRGGLERFLPSGKLNYRDAPWWEPIYAVSFVSRLFFHGIVGVGMDLLKPEEKQALRKEVLKQMRDLFETQVAAFAKKNGIKVSVVAMPLIYELDEASGEYMDLIDVLSGIADIELIDCRPMLMVGTDSDDLYWPRDGHFRPVGYARLAECVHQLLFTSSDKSSLHGN